MNRRIMILITLMIIVGLTGCSKGVKSPEELGEAHFDLYISVLLDKEIDVDIQCKEIYSEDYVDYCKTEMTELKDLVDYKTLTEDDYELYSVTSESMDDSLKNVNGFDKYNEVYEVTVSNGLKISETDDDLVFDNDYTLYVVKIDGEYKAVLNPNLD